MPEKILIALSGGVDSAVAAALLKQAGHELIGVTMQICACDAKMADGNTRHGCYGVDKRVDIEDACRVAQYLGIPFHVVNLCGEYESEVLEKVIAGYRHGRTLNPCVYCNQYIKFGALLEAAEKAGMQFTRIATGHYANIEHDETHRRYSLKKGADTQKDQSYFLSFLNQEQLGRSIFPLGGYNKPQVRHMAEEMGLPIANKPESQDFVSGGYQGLLGAGQPGPVVDIQGRRIGTHNGIECYTVGQHKGLGVPTQEKLYVINILPETNTIVAGKEIDLLRRKMVVNCLNWIAVESLSGATCVDVKIRSKAEPVAATIEPLGESVRVTFDIPQKSVTPGQVAVFYQKDIVLGAGLIDVSF